MSTPPLDLSLKILQEGKISLRGEFMWGSNYTYLTQIETRDRSLMAVYKPTKGVRPLWDFPSASLARREVAAFLVSEALGWELVPPTAYRKDGPLGPGSLQLYVEHDPESHYFNFTPEDRQRLRPVVLFDVLVNNADRKGSHILLDETRHIWLIDHGLCFHVDDKLRTVAWDFAGDQIPNPLRGDLERLCQKLDSPQSGVFEENRFSLWHMLNQFINHSEVAALSRRTERLIASGCFPNPDPNRRQYPWPPV
jgi:uncharacterized repeat protein (TIGR03843 family)